MHLGILLQGEGKLLSYFQTDPFSYNDSDNWHSYNPRWDDGCRFKV